MTFINKRNIYGNEYNAGALCEYQRELKLIRRLINISDKAVEQQTPVSTWSYEGICHSFAKTIVDYSKMAYDNVLLGHFHAVNMITRTVLENLVCLDSESGYIIIDARTQSEYDEGHIPGAILIPEYEIADRAEKELSDKDRLILVYCRSGRRSKIAAEELVKLGYTNIKEFGGIIDWEYEIEK